MEKLKPCPFCGSDDIELSTGLAEYWAFCHDCTATTSMERTQEEAIQVWNTRAT